MLGRGAHMQATTTEQINRYNESLSLLFSVMQCSGKPQRVLNGYSRFKLEWSSRLAPGHRKQLSHLATKWNFQKLIWSSEVCY